MPFNTSNSLAKRTDPLKSSAFNLSSNGDRRSSKEEPHKSLFESLPLEMLQHIARLSSTSAASSLALCNKFICAAVGGPQYWTKLRSEKNELQNFLSLIEQDNPGHWLCHVCHVFHPHRRGFRRTSAYKYICKQTLPCMNLTNLYWGFSENFSHRPRAINHWMVQMVMNRHLWGPEHGLPLNIFSQSRQSINRRSLPKIRFYTEARIFANELYLRCQYVFSVPTSTCIFGWFDGFAICHHVRPRAADLLPSFRRLYGLSHGQGSMDLIQCEYCHTEYDIETLHSGPTHYVIEITSWKNLGSGRTPRDLKWVHHAMCSRDCRCPPFSSGSIRTAFETGKRTNSPKSILKTKEKGCSGVMGT